MKLEVFDSSTGKGNIEGIKSKRKKRTINVAADQLNYAANLGS